MFDFIFSHRMKIKYYWMKTLIVPDTFVLIWWIIINIDFEFCGMRKRNATQINHLLGWLGDMCKARRDKKNVKCEEPKKWIMKKKEESVGRVGLSANIEKRICINDAIRLFHFVLYFFFVLLKLSSEHIYLI